MRHLQTIELHYRGDCELVAVTPDGHIYIDELYEGWTARHEITVEGVFLRTVEDDYENNESNDEFFLPSPDAIRSRPVEHAAHLNFRGGRRRGLREPERVTEWVQSLSIEEKMLLGKYLTLPAMTLLGITESVVLSETAVNGRVLVCRRIRVVYALPEQRFDPTPYDYDSRELYLVQFADHELGQALNAFPEVKLNRPMDCIAAGDYVVIADCGDDLHQSRVHVFNV